MVRVHLIKPQEPEERAIILVLVRRGGFGQCSFDSPDPRTHLGGRRAIALTAPLIGLFPTTSKGPDSGYSGDFPLGTRVLLGVSTPDEYGFSTLPTIPLRVRSSKGPKPPSPSPWED